MEEFAQTLEHERDKDLIAYPQKMTRTLAGGRESLGKAPLRESLAPTPITQVSDDPSVRRDEWCGFVDQTVYA
jgi:hypothetical protein